MRVDRSPPSSISFAAQEMQQLQQQAAQVAREVQAAAHAAEAAQAQSAALAAVASGGGGAAAEALLSGALQSSRCAAACMWHARHAAHADTAPALLCSSQQVLAGLKLKVVGLPACTLVARRWLVCSMLCGMIFAAGLQRRP